MGSPQALRFLLRLDTIGAFATAVPLAVAASLLGGWYQLDTAMVLSWAGVHLAYGLFGAVFVHRLRSAAAAQVLAVANLLWGVTCWVLAAKVASSLSGGFAAPWLLPIHLGFEGGYVGLLGLLQLRWQRHLPAAVGSYA